MSLPELRSAVKTLSRSDKFHLVQFILYELAEEESFSLLKNGKEYPIWSPYNAHEAAEILLNELDRHRTVSIFRKTDKRQSAVSAF